LDPAKVSNLEVLALAPGNDYVVQTLAGFVGAGKTFTFWASSMTAPNHVTIDGSAEATGAFNFFLGGGDDTATGGGGNDLFYGAGGADTLKGNGGSDTFAYLSSASSNGLGGTAYDTVVDFTAGIDKFHFADTTVTTVDGPTSGALSHATLDTDF